TGVSADQVTWGSTALLAVHCAAFLVHKHAFAFAVGVAAFELLDDLDGAVARVTGTASRAGAYLDAMTDRYKEAMVLAVIAAVYGGWPAAFVALFGGFATSYAKARAGMETKVSNVAWPDFFERFERVAFVCVLLVTIACVASASEARVASIGLAVLGAL